MEAERNQGEGESISTQTRISTRGRKGRVVAFEDREGG